MVTISIRQNEGFLGLVVISFSRLPPETMQSMNDFPPKPWPFDTPNTNTQMPVRVYHNDAAGNQYGGAGQPISPHQLAYFWNIGTSPRRRVKNFLFVAAS